MAVRSGRIMRKDSMATIVLTAGHGGKDPGAVNGKDTEAALMTQLRNATRTALADLGHTVITDGHGLENLTLREAIRIIPKGALALELHTNASSNPKAGGVETIGNSKHARLCQDISQKIAEVLNLSVRRDNGWFDYQKTGRVLGYCRAGGIIVETFFISNPTELTAFKEKYWAVARGIAEVVDRHLKS